MTAVTLLWCWFHQLNRNTLELAVSIGLPKLKHLILNYESMDFCIYL